MASDICEPDLVLAGLDDIVRPAIEGRQAGHAVVMRGGDGVVTRLVVFHQPGPYSLTDVVAQVEIGSKR